MLDLHTDPDFQALVKSVSHPDLEAIVALAKKRGVKRSMISGTSLTWLEEDGESLKAVRVLGIGLNWRVKVN